MEKGIQHSTNKKLTFNERVSIRLSKIRESDRDKLWVENHVQDIGHGETKIVAPDCIEIVYLTREKRQKWSLVAEISRH